MLKATVTGAGGFIGGHLVEELLRQGHDVKAVDLRPMYEWKQLHRDALNLQARDLSDRQDAFEAADQADTIFHLAADSGGMGYISYHHADCMLNVLADTQMARAAAETGARIYYASSSCIYPLHSQTDPFTPPIKEELAELEYADPEKGYGWEKYFAEKVYFAFAEEKGLQARVGRYYSVYGPKGWYRGGREKAPTALSRKIATAKLKGDRVIDVWGDGTARRTFTYVDDAVAATIAIAASDCTEPLNVGSPKACSIDELVSTIEEIAGWRVQRNYVDGPVGVGGRPSDDTRIRQAVGWKPQVKFRDGMERTYAWVYDQVKAEMS